MLTTSKKIQQTRFSTQNKKMKLSEIDTDHQYRPLQLQSSIGNQAVVRIYHRNSNIDNNIPERKFKQHDNGLQRGKQFLQKEPNRTSRTHDNEIPSSVNDVLQTPGHRLNPEDRTFFKHRFGLDFSQVRIHSDAKASATAHSVNALAYTVGQNIIFGYGQYKPDTRSGRHLLAHELTHTIQQRDVSGTESRSSIEIGSTRDPLEKYAGETANSIDQRNEKIESHTISRSPLRLHRCPPGIVNVELVPVSEAERENLDQQGIQLPTVSPTTWSAIGGSPYSGILPGYSQSGDTCGASSLVTALIIWDREHWDPNQPNNRVVTACNLILIELHRHGSEAVSRWSDHPTIQVSRDLCNRDTDCIRDAYGIVLQEMINEMQRIRDAGRQPGARISENDYQKLGLALYFLWREGSRGGLSSNQIMQIQNSVGLSLNDPNSSSNIQSFEEIFVSPIITGLQPDQFAQIAWLINNGGHHALLIGRLQSGEWVLSDQGPGREFTASTLSQLRDIVHQAATSGSYWLYVGTREEMNRRGALIGGWTGIIRIGTHTSIERQAQDIVPQNAFLGEVDEGSLTIGNRITRDGFVARCYSLSDTQARFSTSINGGGLIVEMPQGVFSLYTTSHVSTANLSQTVLDQVDSRGGILLNNLFIHTWLRLGTSSGQHGSWFQVY